MWTNLFLLPVVMVEQLVGGSMKRITWDLVISWNRIAFELCLWTNPLGWNAMWNKHEGQISVFKPHLQLFFIMQEALTLGGNYAFEREKFHSFGDILQPCPLNVSLEWVRPPSLLSHGQRSYHHLSSFEPPSDFPRELCHHSVPYEHTLALTLLMLIFD